MKNLLTLITLIGSLALGAQADAYHAQLTNWLATQYTLTGVTYPIADTENEIYAATYSWTASRNLVTAPDDQEFSQVVRLSSPGGLVNRWDAGFGVANIQPVGLGDKLLAVVWLRVDGGEDATGKVALVLERADNFDKEFDLIVELDNSWRRYLIPVEVRTRSHPAGGLQFGIHLGFQEQVVEVGGFTLLNYGPNFPLDQFPNDINNDEYGGFEADAAWRAPAAQRIEELRMADLEILALDQNGDPLPATGLEVRMQRHAFEFGTAIKACRFPGGRCYNATFVDKIFDLDGRGHGFNSVVYENDLKWPAWEEEWISLNEQTIRTMSFLTERDVNIRGHVLLWPGWQNLPADMEANQSNVNYLKQRVDDHLVNFLETLDFDEYVRDWDVINEINTNTDLAAALAGTAGYTTGREYYAEVFARARELAPDATLYLNDYVTLSLNNKEGVLYDQYQGFIAELVNADAPIDGIGFQGHIGASPNSIYDVLETYDDFAQQFGLEAKITEFDLPPSVSEELAADYLRDFLTATFSHESMTGFLFWNFWDVDTWANPGANLYRADWSSTPAHEAFVDLVFNEWWTEEDLQTDASGLASTPAFKGYYEVTLNCGSERVTTSFDHLGDQRVTIDCSQLVSLQPEPLPAGSITVSPNPSSGPVTIQNRLGVSLSGEILDAAGRSLWRGKITSGTTELPLDLPAGSYHLQLREGRRMSTFTLIR
ncbi:endo-1,4-beta-xylanase [Lewinella sp. W8]|uniref:endo-1,4-beta-xylanase n=1 Tax=Lewinella sp. W8 TaxID=2528208 RepID=UPI0010673032|nr:endo-1,4-beta-xylanase [Lewinella sp. W8]MTB50858.1 hypothetical protein [Lewinella sp. W8]